jgi:hypothetical protein
LRQVKAAGSYQDCGRNVFCPVHFAYFLASTTRSPLVSTCSL